MIGDCPEHTLWRQMPPAKTNIGLVLDMSRPHLRRVISILALAALALGLAYKGGLALYNRLQRKHLAGHVVYDVRMDGRAAVSAGLARAAADHKQLLVVMGGNWCEWCLALDEQIHSDPEISTLLERHFVVLNIDADTNDALDSAWGQPRRSGLPVLLLLDQDGRPRQIQETGSLETWGGRVLHFSRTKILELLDRWGPSNASPSHAR
jgi:thiol:disulfide interchange protein